MGAIRVRVIDAETEQPLPGVACILVENNQATTVGAATDGEGMVTLPQPGEYLCRSIGYEHFVATLSDGVTVPMEPKAYELDEVEIIAHKKTNRWPLYVLAAAVILDQHG